MSQLVHCQIRDLRQEAVCQEVGRLQMAASSKCESFRGAVMHRRHRDERTRLICGFSADWYSVILLQCYNDTLCECQSVTVFQCYNYTLLHCLTLCNTLVHCYICEFWTDWHRRSHSHRHHCILNTKHCTLNRTWKY